MALIGYASLAYREENSENAKWSQSFRRLMTTIRPTSHDIVMLLTLLSGAMRDGRPLPPFLQRPAPYALSDRLEHIDSDILSVRHVNEPGYAAFAVLQLASRCISVDLDTVLENIKELVGELDFSIHVSESTGSDLADETEKKKED
jgi:hypothetical protein